MRTTAMANPSSTKPRPSKPGWPSGRALHAQEEPGRYVGKPGEEHHQKAHRKAEGCQCHMQDAELVIAQNLVVKCLPGLSRSHDGVGLNDRRKTLAVDPEDQIAELHSRAI